MARTAVSRSRRDGMTANDGLPVRPRNPARQVGESYRDCVDRLSGELRAAQLDRDRLAGQRRAALALHWKTVDSTTAKDYVSCNECAGGEWPCPTAAALGVTA